MEKSRYIKEIIDTVDDIVAVQRPDHTIEFYNQAGYDFLGLPPEEVDGKKCYQLMNKEQPCDICPTRKLLQTKEKEEAEVFISEEDLHLKCFSKPIFDKKGNLVRIVEHIKDITAEKELDKEKNNFENLINQVPGMTYRYRLYPDGSSSFPYSSKGIYEIFEVTPEEVDKDASKVYERIHPDDYDKLVESIIESAEKLEIWKEEYRVVLPDKGTRWVEGNARPEKLADGSILWYGNIYDITERKKQELKVSRQRDRLNWIIEGTNSGTWEWNIQTGETIFNEKWAEMLGYKLKELKPTTIEIWKSLTHPDDLKRSEKALEEHFNGKNDLYSVKIRMKHKEGHWVWILDQGKVVSRTADGRPLKMFGIHMDISKQKKYERIIEELHNVAIDFQELNDEELICQKTIEAASKILNFDLCHLSLAKDNKFVPIAYSAEMDVKTLSVDYGIAGKAFINNKNYLTLDTDKDSDAAPTKELYKSAITLSLENLGVFQAISTEKNFFTDKDLKLAETLISSTTAALNRIYSQANLEEKHKFMKETKERLDREINKAKKFHEKSLPTNIPEIEGLNIYAYYQPMNEIGGDFYNFIKLADRKLLFYLIDITGHGLDAALMSSFVKNTINTYIKLLPEDKDISPKEVIEFLYRQNQSENFPEDYFITMLLGVIDTENQSLVYSSAGMHVPPVICDRGIKELPAGKLPISKIIKKELTEYNNIEVKLTEGNNLFISTDGLFEQSRSEEIYGDSYKEIICQNRNLPPGAIVEEINKEFTNFSEGNINDDITYALIQIESDQKYPELNFEINSSKEEVDRAKLKVERFIGEENKEINIDDITIAFHEMLINALEHGNKFVEAKKIKIRVELKADYIQISVKDEGEGFNWMQVKEEKSGTIFDIQDEVATRGRGLGFMMARIVSDYFYYNYEGNQVIFIKEY